MLTLNPESSSDLVPPSPAKKQKPNSPEKHDSGISGRKHRSERKHRCGITDAYLKKLCDEKTTNYWDDAAKLRASRPKRRTDERPAYGPKLYPPEPLPKGYAWGSYIIGSDKKDLAYRMLCAHCGKGGDHMTDECQDKDSEEAKAYRKQHEESMKQLAAYLKARRSSDHETKPDNK